MSTTEFVHMFPATLGDMSKLAALPTRLKDSAMPKAVASSAPLNQRAVIALWATDTLSPPRPNTVRPMMMSMNDLVLMPTDTRVWPQATKTANMMVEARMPSHLSLVCVVRVWGLGFGV